MAIARFDFSPTPVQGTFTDPIPRYWLADTVAEGAEIASGAVANENGPDPYKYSSPGDLVYVRELKALHVLLPFKQLRRI